MNPQSNQTPGLRLPQPSFDLGQAPAAQPAEAFRAPAAPMSVPVSPAPAMQAPQAPVPAGAIPVAPATQAAPVVAQSQAVPGMPVAPMQDVSAAQGDDESAVDQEWITKAKEMVERTHSDPYLQSNELSKIKAQYIKVRYNKDIKIVED